MSPIRVVYLLFVNTSFVTFTIGFQTLYMFGNIVGVRYIRSNGFDILFVYGKIALKILNIL